MYSDVVTSQDEALCHLFLHCCYKDGSIDKLEIDALASRLTKFNLEKSLNFKNEVVKYRSYMDATVNEPEYLEYLISKIHPTNELALYSYCLELSLSNSKLDLIEEELLNNIADVLDIKQNYREAIQALMVQRNIVDTAKYF